MGPEIKKVSELVSSIKNTLEREYANISLEGEITNLSLSSSGHWYFTLSDKDASVSAALFKMDALRNPQMRTIKDGDQVIVSGDVNVYPKRGTFQVIVKRIVPKGLGNLKEQFEKLKRRLASEGLFDLESKMPIPPLPKRVAIITAQRGAALQDFLNIYKRRSLWMDVLVVPTLVQGDEAPKAIRASLHNVIKYSMEAAPDKKIDVIVLARGGGSLEDLWAFNDEGLAYDIHACPIPIISAVGHEVDFSISDFVSDHRCETPSAAAEMLTHQQTMIKDRMTSLRRRLLSMMEIKTARLTNRLKHAQPHNVLNIILRNMASLERRLARCHIQNRLHELTKIHHFYLALDDNIQRLQQVMKDKMTEYKNHLKSNNELLKVLNPKNVLERGYGYVEAEKGKVISGVEEFDALPAKRALNIHFHDGTRKVVKET
jgi:exodeoxyribonuclease VII large subunit